MQTDWNSLFFTYRPHADQRPHEDRLLLDVGLTKTIDGGLALAEDPTHRVDLDRPGLSQRIGAFLRRLFPAQPNAFARYNPVDR